MHLKKSAGSFEEGAYACVFFCDEHAVKVFKRRAADQETHVRSVFQSEVMAYQRASVTDALRDLVSHFIGPVSCASITDAAGNNISQEFFLDCAYKMRRIEGDFKKFGTLDEQQVRDSIRTLFHAAGIRHIIDCSAVISGDRISSVVDFAMQEYVLEHPNW